MSTLSFLLLSFRLFLLLFFSIHDSFLFRSYKQNQFERIQFTEALWNQSFDQKVKERRYKKTKIPQQKTRIFPQSAPNLQISFWISKQFFHHSSLHHHIPFHHPSLLFSHQIHLTKRTGTTQRRRVIVFTTIELLEPIQSKDPKWEKYP